MLFIIHFSVPCVENRELNSFCAFLDRAIEEFCPLLFFCPIFCDFHFYVNW